MSQDPGDEDDARPPVRERFCFLCRAAIVPIAQGGVNTLLHHEDGTFALVHLRCKQRRRAPLGWT